MDLIIVIALVITWILVWRWVVNMMRQNGKGWFLRHLAGSSLGSVAGLLVVILALSVGIISPENKAAEKVVLATESSPVEVRDDEVPKLDVVKAKTLAITPDEYVRRLNKILKSLDVKHRVKANALVKGEVNDVLSSPIGKYASLTARVSKADGEIVEVVIIGAGDGTHASGLEIMMIATAGLTAAVPGAEFKQVFRELPEMMRGKTRSYGSIQLSVNSTEELGTWFFASPL